MSVLLVLWAVWAGLILAHPLHEGGVRQLLDAQRRHDVDAWLLVTTAEQDASARFAPALVDPLSQRWDETELGAGVVDGASQTSAPGAGDSPQIAWHDSDGAHVTRDFSTGRWRFPKDGSSLPLPESSPSAAAYRTLVLGDDVTRAPDIRGLWWFGSVPDAKGYGSITVFGVIALLSFLVGVDTLLSRPPRFRTRWSWFWILGCPMGAGFVWLLLREGWFGRSRAPEPGGRATGLQGFGAFVLVSLTLGSAVGTWIVH